MSAHLSPELREALETVFVLTYEHEHDIGSTIDTVVRFLDHARASRMGVDTSVAIGVASLKRRRRGTASLPKIRAAQRLAPEVARIADEHGLSARLLTGDSLVPSVVAVRYEAYYRLHRLGRHSLPIVGLAVGGRNHSTVFTGVRKFEARLAAEANLRARIGELAKAEGGGARLKELAAVDPCEAGEAAPVVRTGGPALGPAVSTGDGRLAAGGLSASPAKLSRRAA